MNTIIEKIRAEIERRKKQMVDASYPPVIKKTRISELSIVLDILDDIQERTDNPITFTLQEQPVDWQKVAEAHAKDQPLGQDNDGNLVYLQEHPACEDVDKMIAIEMVNVYENYTRPDYIEQYSTEASVHFESYLAHYFYELGRQSKPKVCEDLETEALRSAGVLLSEHFEDEDDDAIRTTALRCWKGGFIAGANWQKEQMMKEAVEGEIINAGYPTKIELDTFYSKFEHGQRVKLIIIKEDTK